MGAMMAALMSAGRRHEDKDVQPPRPMPVVTRAERIIAEGHAKRVSYGRINPAADSVMCYGAQIGFLHGQIQRLCGELDSYVVQRDAGLLYATVSDDALGGDVWVGYAYSPEVPARITSAQVLERTGDPGDPGYAETFDLQEVWVNGVELMGALSDAVLDRLSDAALQKARAL